MPKKPQKSRAEKTVEEFFPLDKDNKKIIEKIEKAPNVNEIMRKTVTKAVQQMPERVDLIKSKIEKINKKPLRKDLETIEKVGEIKAKKKTRYSKTKKFIPKKVAKKYETPEISLKKKGYELVITEKPQAAQKIAQALGKSVKRTLPNKVSYYEVDREGRKIVVACAVGHLLTLKQNVSGSQVPIFDISWVPNYMVLKKDFTKRYYDTILKLVKGADEITVATDFDIEGELIGWNAVRFICGQKDANRMKFSTLTDKELNQAYDEKLNHIYWGQAIAGETRHYLDWFYGINLSRALMNAIKSTGRFKIMSIGRVQGPALNLIVKKEREIKSFKPQTYWQVFIDVDDGQNQLELIYNKDLFNKKELSKFDNLTEKEIDLITTKKEQYLKPLEPFNLSTLQTEAYKFHGITPSNTLKAAQSLYLAGLISYPRTSSQKLPPSIGYQEILKKLSKKYGVEKLITQSQPIEGKKSDPAHPSIYPTGQDQILSGDEEKIYNLIVKRFLSLFCDDAIIDIKTIKTEIQNEKEKLVFSTKGSTIRKKAWLEIYPAKMQEHLIPDMKDKAKITKVRNEQKETQAPKRYSPASIVTELEKRNLGTKATRASIIETLFDRGYIKDRSIEATPLGESLIETMEKYSPIIIDEELTRNIEKEMDIIAEAKTGLENREKKVIQEAKLIIEKIAKQFEQNEKKIGEELLKANQDLLLQKREENKLMPCPQCKKGNLIINYSKKNRRFFIACDAYPACTKTYSLPPNGSVKKAEKNCEECSFPMVMILRSGKRPWMLCFNPNCPTNKKRLEEYQAKKELEIKE